MPVLAASIRLTEILLAAPTIPDTLARAVAESEPLVNYPGVRIHMARPEFAAHMNRARATVAESRSPGRRVLRDIPTEVLDMFAVVHAIRAGANPQEQFAQLIATTAGSLNALHELTQSADLFPHHTAITALLEATASHETLFPRVQLARWSFYGASFAWMKRAARAMSEYALANPKDKSLFTAVDAVEETVRWRDARKARGVVLDEYLTELTSPKLLAAALIKLSKEDAIEMSKHMECLQELLIDRIILPFLDGKLRGQVTPAQMRELALNTSAYWGDTHLLRVVDAAEVAMNSRSITVREHGGWLLSCLRLEAIEARERLANPSSVDAPHTLQTMPLDDAAEAHDPNLGTWTLAQFANQPNTDWADVLRVADLVGSRPLRDLVDSITTTLT